MYVIISSDLCNRWFNVRVSRLSLWQMLMFQGDAKEEEEMSVDSDEEPHSYPITTPLSQSKSVKPPPTKLRVSFGFLVTFHMRHSQGKMYIGHTRLYLCLSVCPSPHSHTTAQTWM